MEVWLEHAMTTLSASGPVRGLVAAVPVAITVAGIAGWRQRVEGAAPIALFGIAFCLWLAMPWNFAYLELRQTSLVLSILCWIWLVWAWARHVLGEWPAPIWGHWIVGTLLWVLPLTAGIVLLLG
ncbi:MAG: hypothetical protein Q27BPR15_14900 [Rhodobacter sp. CACIA14H1]|nr:MAG: hypothetical protein Q27BPR15_14900 [Rhodobacter sp. CACIA14H1]